MSINPYFNHYHDDNQDPFLSCLSIFLGIVLGLVFCAILGSCGSSKSIIKERTEIHVDSIGTTSVNVFSDSTARRATNSAKVDSSSIMTKEASQSFDTTFVVETTETTWYDTDKANSNGLSPIARKEVKTVVRKTGRTVTQGLSNLIITTSAAVADTDSHVAKTAMQKATVTAKVDREQKSQTDVRQSRTETKQSKYFAMILYGIAAVIFVGVIAYVVFCAYRARDQTK